MTLRAKTPRHSNPPMDHTNWIPSTSNGRPALDLRNPSRNRHNARLTPLPMLLIALLALGGVLLWSMPAQAQVTSRILVSNVGQVSDDNAETSGNDHAQLFHTGGATNGYILTSVIVVSEDTQGDDFDVDVCKADSSGFPTSPCTELLPPDSFTAGSLEFTFDDSQIDGLYLSPNTNYVAVIKQNGSESVTLDSTTSAGEDFSGLSGWSLKDKFDFESGSTWKHKSGSNEAIRITVKGLDMPANKNATGRPVILASAEGAGILFASTEAIADRNGLPVSGGVSFTTYTWTYQWIRVDGNSQTNVGANSASYQPVEADVGKLIKVTVSFRDGYNYSEARTSLPVGPIAELAGPSATPSTLVSNTGQSHSAKADITKQYAQGFRLGDHGQGYEISSVSIELAAVPSSLTVSLWSAGVQGAFLANTATKLFDFADPSSFAVGLNKFTAPAGAFAYQGVNYFIVLSGFGTTLSINETTSDAEDPGGETGAVIYNDAAVRALTETGTWSISTSSLTSVLRLDLKGSERARGILASNYAQPKIDDKGTDDTADDVGLHQEIISVGDKIGFGFELGEADRYLIRGVSLQHRTTQHPPAADSPTRSSCARVPGRAPCSSA